MAGWVVPNALKLFLQGDLAVDSGNSIRVALVDTSWTETNAADTYDDISTYVKGGTPAAGVSTNPELTCDTTTTAGTCHTSTTPQWTAVTTGATIEGIMVYRYLTDAASSHLIAWLDEGNVTGFPLTTNGGGLTITFSSGNVFSI